MIRRVIIPKYGTPEVMRLATSEPPDLKPGSIRIRVAAAGINFADILMRRGLYPETPSPPIIPGFEVSGTVMEVGPQDPVVVAQQGWLKPGNRVMAVTRFGGYAEQVVTPATKTIPLPDNWSFEQGASFPIGFLTAWLGLVKMARIASGDHVLLHGAAGGVGLAAVQIAQAVGARVAGKCGHHKLERLRKLGIDLALDHDDVDWINKLRDWAPLGPKIILDPRGGKGLKESIELVRPTGSVVSFGFSEILDKHSVRPARSMACAGRLLYFNPLSLIARSIGVHMLNILNLWDPIWPFGEFRDAAVGAIERGRFQPNLDHVFPVDQVARAHQYLEDRLNFGKVVLRWDS